MYLIVGLGNPEPEYSNTRHNMGFDVINTLSKKNKIEVCKRKFNGLYGMGEIVTTEFDANTLDESQIDEKFDEAIDNYNDLCDTLAE